MVIRAREFVQYLAEQHEGYYLSEKRQPHLKRVCQLFCAQLLLKLCKQGALSSADVARGCRITTHVRTRLALPDTKGCAEP